jgi:hypothetical protein
VVVRWVRDGDAFYATAAAAVDYNRCYLTVERLPDREAWDWAIWTQRPGTSLVGRAACAWSAMIEAETCFDRGFPWEGDHWPYHDDA